MLTLPSHVDFRAEVAASLAACEYSRPYITLTNMPLAVFSSSLMLHKEFRLRLYSSMHAVLLTLQVANFFLAHEKDLPMIPVLNKIDLPNAEPERIADQIEETFGIDRAEMIHVSAKKGINVESLLPVICERVPRYYQRPQNS